MNIVAHMIFPVASAQLVNICRVHVGKPRVFNWKHLLIIGVCGGLPDILSPHTGLTAGYNSFFQQHLIKIIALMRCRTSEIFVEAGERTWF